MQDAVQPTGLRARKKAKTQTAIQQAALVLFRAQGYAETTVEQIAEAAEISPSTFYRYFSTKEEVALFDFFDPLVFNTSAAHFAEMGLIPAVRLAIREIYGALSPEQKTKERERVVVVDSVPELRMRMVDRVTQMAPRVARMISEQAGQTQDDIHVLSLVGAVMGVMIAVYLSAPEHPDWDLPSILDNALAELERIQSTSLR